MAIASAIKPGLAMVMTSAIVGIGVFVAMLLYGPEQSPPPATFSVQGGTGFSPSGIRNTARNLTATDRDAEAITALTGYLAQNPDNAWCWMYTAQLCLRTEGNPAELARRTKTLAECKLNLARLEQEGLLPPTQPSSLYTSWFVSGWAAWASGDEPRSAEIFMAGFEQVEIQIGQRTVGSLYDGACFLALAGRVDEAADRVARLAEIGYNNPRWLGQDPDLDALRGHPVFEAALEKLINPPVSTALPTSASPTSASQSASPDAQDEASP